MRFYRNVLISGVLTLFAHPIAVYAVPIHTDYAVLFSGGGNSDINHTRYYEETRRMWSIATDTLGFDPRNIYILFADGDHPGEDQNTGTGKINSEWGDIDATGTSILSASLLNLQNSFEFFDDLVSEDDSFYFWAFDHGDSDQSSTDTSDVVLTAWDDESIRDDVFASLVDDFIDPKAEIYAFGQCYSGGMADDLLGLGHSNLSVAWAAASTECSYGKGWIDAWADGIESGLRWSNQLGSYAYANDPFGPNGSGQETPGWAGANIHIVTNNIPEPATLALIGLGLASIGFARKKK